MPLTYDEAQAYLKGLINYEIQRPDRYTPDVISLDRPRALMHALGDPQETYPVIHVTGTKGKGSVSAMCASVLQAAGLRVGLYSSPNLQDFRERFRINNDLIDPAHMAALVDRVKPVVETVPGLSWFEVTTAIGFLYFAEAKADIVVLEVGLGGRLDATNIVRAPLVSTITSLSYDHMYLLGNTLAEIAFEKAGIIKPGVPIVSAPQKPEALTVLERTAAERGAPLTLVGRDFEFHADKSDVNGETFTANQHGSQPRHYWTPLLGEHQVVNAAVALATLEHVRHSIFPQRAAIDDHALDRGLRLVNWPGRLEVVRRAPWLILDVAHNGESAERLRNALVSIFPVDKRTLIFGALSDKDVPGMFRELLPITSELVLMQTENPRAFSAEHLAEMAQQAGYTGPMATFPNPQAALAYAESITGPNDLICVTGSLSMVGDMRTILGLTPARAAYLDEAPVQTLQNTIQSTR